MECFLRETELPAAAPSSPDLVRAPDILPLALSFRDDFTPRLTGTFEVLQRGSRFPPPNQSGKWEAATARLNLC